MNYPFIRQQSDWDCSLACIFMLAKHFHYLSLNYFQFVQDSRYFQDLNLTQMQTIANKMGVFLASYFVQWNNFHHRQLKTPWICQVRNKERLHFVVVYEKTTKQLLIADPQKQTTEWWTFDRFQQIYTGIVLVSDKSVYLPSLASKGTNNLVFWNKLLFELVVSFCISILTTATVILNQFLVKIIVDEVLVKQIPNMVVTILIGFSILFITKLLLRLILDIVLDKVEINFKKSWNLKFFSQVSQLTFTNYQKYKTVTLLQNYRYFNEILHFYFPTSFYILENCFLALTSLGILMSIQINIIIPTLLLIILAFIVYALLFPWLQNLNYQQIDCDKKFQKHLLDFFDNYLHYQNRNRITLPLNQLQSQLNKQVDLSRKSNVMLNLQTVINQVFIFFTNLTIIYFLLNFDSKTIIKSGSFVFLFALINNLVGKSGWFFRHFMLWQKLQEPMQQVNAFLFNSQPHFSASNNPFFQTINKIELKEINYSHYQNDRLWKNNINLVLPKHLSVYGRSGIGKTTLLQIIARNLPSYHGQLRFNNKLLSKDCSDYGSDKVYFLQANTSVIPGTLLDNVLLFAHKRDFLVTWKTNRLDYFCQKINLQPNTWISDQTISTGQRQVVNFLTLFFAREPILLLDESLNSVNGQLKIALLKQLFIFHQNTFIIYATHDQQIANLFSQKLHLVADPDEK